MSAPGVAKVNVVLREQKVSEAIGVLKDLPVLKAVKAIQDHGVDLVSLAGGVKLAKWDLLVKRARVVGFFIITDKTYLF